MPWAEGEHVLQLYPQAAAETGIGTAFAAEGLRQDHSVVVIATSALREKLLRQLGAAGLDAQGAVAEGRLRLFGALDARAYEGALERLGALHTHLVPVDNCEAFDDAVGHAVAEVLEPRLLRMVHALSATHRPAIHVPSGVALLFWLRQHMPRTAEKVLARSRTRWIPR